MEVDRGLLEEGKHLWDLMTCYGTLGVREGDLVFTMTHEWHYSSRWEGVYFTEQQRKERSSFEIGNNRSTDIIFDGL